MIRFYRVVGVGPAYGVNWALGQFADAEHALDEYNAEVRRAQREGFSSERPELTFVDGLEREAEYFLVEEEITHTPEKRDEAFESGRWALAKTINRPV